MIIVDKAAYLALVKRVARLEQLVEELLRPAPDQPFAFLETPGLSDAGAYTWMFNNLEADLLNNGKMAIFRGVGGKAEKLGWLLKSNHAEHFNARMSEERMVVKIIELRAVSPFVITG